MRCLLLQVEELYDAYCIQRRLRDGASKMVAAFNTATGSKEARESLSEANKGYRECTEASDGRQCVCMFQQIHRNRCETMHCMILCSTKSLSCCSNPSFHLSLQHMCSLESEFESQMGEFHVKMKGESLFTTSYFVHSVLLNSSNILISSFGCVRPRRLCTPVCW